MFYRYLDPTHPANAGKDTEVWKDAIARVYERADQLLGKVWHLVDDPETTFMVISDHGFTNFRRCVNLNSWLRDNGYLFLKDENARTSGEYLDGVDWSRTRAFALGLTGLFINRKGREKSGIVEEGTEYREARAGARREARTADRSRRPARAACGAWWPPSSSSRAPIASTRRICSWAGRAATGTAGSARPGR